ncbi:MULTISPECIES: SMI1/KNR4 family protein [unclassified Modicisalibacter]|uniref:SMI1/KNR4 family protein n=1 Tax=unclassified Modicisalibacter TaxID=2679913 RepID=UPI001CCE3387|nr:MULTISPECIES: SMI1/KNR4 family protein [unclassified Modicisalibacter]MBZ9558060.1 SMI1/KNR4 family protein [Modicisalibacter sp. R2A 31.J]MBZ9573271.1 SMI1/KNR4 family protein [Modicisalibacter sp. MOD 31.J]
MPYLKHTEFFLLSHGRCMFSGDATITDIAGNEREIFTMFGKGESGGVIEDYHIHPSYALENLIPIADDMFNNRFAMKYTTGEIFFLDHSPGENKCVKVAKSFTDFLEMINIEPGSG